MQYGTLSEADTYFETRLYSELWPNTPNQDRDAALIAATRIIDRLNFAGMKAAAYTYAAANPGALQTDIDAAGLAQELQFPRGTDVEVPSDVKIASYEIAFALISGREPDTDYEDLPAVSEGYSSVRRTYVRSFVQEHLNHGVPSGTAWRLLKPYLRDAKGVQLSRVS